MVVAVEVKGEIVTVQSRLRLNIKLPVGDSNGFSREKLFAPRPAAVLNRR